MQGTAESIMVGTFDMVLGSDSIRQVRESLPEWKLSVLQGR
jgi:hypothetical protein